MTIVIFIHMIQPEHMQRKPYPFKKLSQSSVHLIKLEIQWYSWILKNKVRFTPVSDTWWKLFCKQTWQHRHSNTHVKLKRLFWMLSSSPTHLLSSMLMSLTGFSSVPKTQVYMKMQVAAHLKKTGKCKGWNRYNTNYLLNGPRKSYYFASKSTKGFTFLWLQHTSVSLRANWTK